MILKRYIRRHFIESAVRAFRPSGNILEIGSGRKWRYFAGSLTFNRDLSAEPDVVGDAENMEFQDGEFDAVVCLEVIEHTTSPSQVVAEIFRVTKPGGSVLLTVPFVFEIHSFPHDYYRFTKNGLQYMFRQFSSVDIKTNGGKWCVIGHFLGLGGLGRLLFPVFNILGLLLDSVIGEREPRITLGYTVLAIR